MIFFSFFIACTIDLVNSGKLDDLEPSTWAEIVKTDDIYIRLLLFNITIDN